MNAMDGYCCERMHQVAEQTCEFHPDRFACPDSLVHRLSASGEYGLIVHDGGQSIVRIAFCPWCGTRLPGALESLTRILQDPGEIPALRGAAAHVLAAIQSTKVVPLLSEMARTPSENDQVRFCAALSVIRVVDGAIDDPLLLIPLQNGYVDLQVRLNLCELGQLAEDTENALAKVAKQGKTPAVRLAASQVLAEFRQQRGQQPDDEKPHDPSGEQDAP